MTVRSQSRSLLVVSVEPEVFARLPPLLWRSAFDVSTPADPHLAMQAITQRAFSLIITGYPLADVKYQDFLDEVRGFGSPCRAAALLALATDDRLKEARVFVGKGLNDVVSVSDSDEVLEAAVAKLLEIAPRANVRILINMKSQVLDMERKVLTQTMNISRTGMLVRSDGSFRIGRPIGFQFTLPGTESVVEGEGEVVRITEKGWEGATGIGIRFVRFEGDGLHLLEEFVDRVLAAKA